MLMSGGDLNSSGLSGLGEIADLEGQIEYRLDGGVLRDMYRKALFHTFGFIWENLR